MRTFSSTFLKTHAALFSTGFDEPQSNKGKKGETRCSTLSINILKLLAYQEHSIAEHQFAAFPKAAEQHIVGQVGYRATAYFLGAKEQTVLQAAA
jgi:hypothetical protein